METKADMPPTGGLKRIWANFAYLLGGKAGAGLLSLVYLGIAAHQLGPSGFGILALMHAYVTLVGGIVAFSGWHPLVRFGTRALKADEPGNFMRLTRFMTLVELSFAIAAILIAMALAPLVGPKLDWPPGAEAFAIPYAFALLATVRTTPHAILQIAGRFDLIALQQQVNPLVRISGALLALVLSGDLLFFLAVWLASCIAEWASMWWLGLRELARMKLGQPFLGPVRGTARDHPGLIPFMLGTNLDWTLREAAPKLAPLAVGWILGPAAAGLYALAARASIIFAQPALLISQANFAVFAEQHAEGDRAGLRQSVWKSGALPFLAALPILAVMSFFARDILTLFGGKQFAGGAALLVLLAAARMIALFVPAFSNGLIAMGHPSRSIAAGAIANLGLLPLLVWMMQSYGLIGAGWQAIIAALSANLLLLYWFERFWRRGD